jgi:hypothetical protein
MLATSADVNDPQLRSYASLDLHPLVSRKGVVPTTPGARPFWTSSPNPQSCTLEENESCTLTWEVIGEGPADQYVFFAYVDDDYRVSTTNEEVYALVDALATISYDHGREALSSGSYDATITLFDADPDEIAVTIDADDPIDDVDISVARSDASTYSFTRTITGVHDGSYIERVRIDDAIEIVSPYTIDTIAPTASLPALLGASGSFSVFFDEPMDRSNSSVAFPQSAQVGWSGWWASDDTFTIEYSSSNATFDEVIELSHGFVDHAGNRAVLPGVRLDALMPTLVGFEVDEVNLSLVGTATINLSFSEPVVIIDSDSDEVGCVIIASSLECSARKSISGSNASISILFEDESGNRASALIDSGIFVDSVQPVASLPPLVPASGSFTILFDEPMDTSLSFIGFPAEALVVSNVSWFDDRSLNVSYSSSNGTFDEIIDLEHGLTDAIGNPAIFASLRLDARAPMASLPPLVPASGSFTILFDEPMDTTRSFIGFPAEALVVSNVSWFDDRSLNVSYSSSNATFDELIGFDHDLMDPAGNLAQNFSARLDAKLPELDGFAMNASVLGANGTVRLTIDASEPLASFEIASEHMMCSVLSASQARCWALDGVETSDALIALTLIDRAGNRARFDIASGLLVDSLAPRIEPMTVRSDRPSDVVVSYDDLTNITIPELGFDSSLNDSVRLDPNGPTSFEVFDAFDNRAILQVTFEEEVSGSGSSGSSGSSAGGSSTRRSGGSSIVMSEPVQDPEPIEEPIRIVEPFEEEPFEEPVERITIAAMRTSAQPIERSLERISTRPDASLFIPLLVAFTMGLVLMRRVRSERL